MTVGEDVNNPSPHEDFEQSKNQVETNRKSVQERFEFMLKFAGIGGALTALMGLPAVYLHFQRYGVPAHFIDYQMVLKAGILPTLLLCLLVGYLIWLGQDFARGNRIADIKLLPMLLGLPVAILFIPLAIGCLAYAIQNLLEVTTNIDDRMRLFASIGIAVPISVVVAIRYCRKRKMRAKNEEYESKDEKSETKDEAANNNAIVIAIFSGWFLVPILLFMLLMNRQVMVLWDSNLEERISTSLVVLFGLVLGALFVLASNLLNIAESQKTSNDSLKKLAATSGVAALIFLFLTLAALYSSEIYPNLSRALGGGKPVSVSLWLSKENQLVFRRGGGDSSSGVASNSYDALVRINDIYMVHATKDYSVFVDQMDYRTDKLTGMVLRNSQIRAISWAVERPRSD